MLQNKRCDTHFTFFFKRFCMIEGYLQLDCLFLLFHLYAPFTRKQRVRNILVEPPTHLRVHISKFFNCFYNS